MTLSLSYFLPRNLRYMLDKPLIVICGTTGVGKSKLAVELALRQNGKIINADAMQAYEGLDILTNKIPIHERLGVEHALLGFKRPGEQYVVGEWIQDATEEVSLLNSCLIESCLVPRPEDRENARRREGAYPCRWYCVLDSPSCFPPRPPR